MLGFGGLPHDGVVSYTVFAVFPTQWSDDTGGVNSHAEKAQTAPMTDLTRWRRCPLPCRDNFILLYSPHTAVSMDPACEVVLCWLGVLVSLRKLKLW